MKKDISEEVYFNLSNESKMALLAGVKSACHDVMILLEEAAFRIGDKALKDYIQVLKFKQLRKINKKQQERPANPCEIIKVAHGSRQLTY
jgi:hypothetical protein